jgi:hypothetical protein
MELHTEFHRLRYSDVSIGLNALTGKKTTQL